MGLFRYSGNKEKLVKYYKTPPKGTKRIVELFLGSGAYSIANSEIPAIGYEINSYLCEMWNFLKTTSKKELEDLDAFIRDCKSKEEKPDCKLLGLPKGKETYVRVNCTGVYTGQLSAWKIYPQHSLPIDKTITLLPKIQQIEIANQSFETYQQQEGDLVFCDPPYIGTIANYKSGKSHEDKFNPETVSDFLKTLTVPIIFTYGTSCQTVFPDYEWQKILDKKVPNIRCGGTVDRTENVCYINWPKD